MAADHDEVIAAALDLADGDLHGAPAILDVGAHPDAHRPLASASRAACRPAVRAMPTQGSRAISVLQGLGRRIAPGGLDRAEGHRRVLRVAPVHHHAAGGAHEGGDALLFVARRMIGELGQRDLAGGIAARVFAEGPEATSISSPERPSGKVGRLWPKVLASITSSTGASTLQLALFGKTDEPGHLEHPAPIPRPCVSAAALYSAMRLPLAEPARREGISVVMCSTWALHVGGRHGADDVFFRHASSSPLCKLGYA